MGQSLADLLGPALAARQATEVAPAVRDCENTDRRNDSEANGADDPVWLALRAALADATGVAQEQIHSAWELVADGDLHPIARYGVVARVESETKLRTRDAQVDTAVTAADLRECFR